MSVELLDTHCHIHEAVHVGEGKTVSQDKWARSDDPNPDHIIARADDAGVKRLVCVGTFVEDSELAVGFVQDRPNTWASIGIHPHEAQVYVNDQQALARFKDLADKPKVVAVGECGLDFYYDHSPREAQEPILRMQIELALKHDLPMIFHVRDAFEEFWPIFDEYQGIRGTIHSFTATQEVLDQALERGLYIGLNGIMTFTKDPAQLEAAKAVPLDRLVLETDAPFLTPAPHRGKICEPKHVLSVAEFLADLRGEPLEEFAKATTTNAAMLFGLR